MLDLASLKRGDIVGLRRQAATAVVIGRGMHLSKNDVPYVCWFMPSGGVSPINDAGAYELHKVAHYADPGVPMIAMTPERIAALNYALHALLARDPMPGSASFDCDIPAVKAMLAEARGERVDG